MTEVRKDMIVDDRYQVLERLGSGGMADVFCAQDLQLGRKVALKLLYRRFAEDESFVERFRREASAAAGLQHPNVVAVYDRGSWDGTYYIAMEFLDGRSLKEVVQAEGPLEPVRAVEHALQILRATRFAHKRGVIHRDLKPHNVIVGNDGRSKVTDFGIARAGASDMTETGSIMGTAQYLSPEQAQGHAVSAASDLYSIGIILYELLTGRVPFEGDSAVTIALKQVSEQPVAPRELNPAIPPDLEAVVLRALEKDPARRFADADEFIGALEAVRPQLIAGQTGPTALAVDPAAGVLAAPPLTGEEVVVEEGPVAPLEEDPRGRRWWPALLVGLLVAGAVVAALLLLGEDRVRVPAVVDANVSAATESLRDRGFEVEAVRDTSSKPRNQVIAQDPDPGELVPEGSTVRIVVSDGPGLRSVPDVVDERRSTAIRRLESRGFRVRERREDNDEVPENRVIETSPAAGQQIPVGETVTMVVSRGPSLVAVPRVTGRSEDQARRALEDAGFRVSAEREETGDAEAGTVLRQSPGAGARAREGSSVTIVVASEPRDTAVPDVTGERTDDATEALERADLEVVTRETEVGSPDEDGRVVRQNPSGGRRVEKGSTVTITVGRFEPDLDPEGGTQTTPGGSTTPDTGGTTTTAPSP